MKSFFKLSIAGAACALALSACGGGEPQPTSFPGIIVDGKYGYYAGGTSVYKFDADTGTQVWHYPQTENRTIFYAGKPLKFGDLIIVGGATAPNGGFDNHLYALNEQTGQLVWSYMAGTPQAPGKEFVDGVVTDGKLLYAANGDHSLYALDPAQMENGSPKTVWTFTSGNKLWSRPLVADGIVYQGSLDHDVYALDAATGKVVWQFTVPTAPIVGQPSLVNGTLYIGAFDNTMYAIDAKSGQQKWAAPLGAWAFIDPLVANDMVYFGDVKGKVYALDAASGALNWWFNIDGTSEIRGQPVLSGTTLFVVGGDTKVYGLDATGAGKDANGKVDFKDKSVRKNETLGRRLFSTPVLYGKNLLVAPLDGSVRVFALNTESPTLATQWSFPPPAQNR